MTGGNARAAESGASVASKRPVHDVDADISVYRVTKRLWHGGQDLKAERAPQPDRWRIGFDDRIELHRPVAIGACLVKDMAAQSTACAAAFCCRCRDACGRAALAGSGGMASRRWRCMS